MGRSKNLGNDGTLKIIISGIAMKDAIIGLVNAVK